MHKLFFILMTASSLALAGQTKVNICTDADGNKFMTDRPCPTEAQAEQKVVKTQDFDPITAAEAAERDRRMQAAVQAHREAEARYRQAKAAEAQRQYEAQLRLREAQIMGQAIGNSIEVPAPRVPPPIVIMH